MQQRNDLLYVLKKNYLWCGTFLRKCSWEAELTMIYSQGPREMMVTWISVLSLEMMRNRQVKFVDFYPWNGRKETN